MPRVTEPPFRAAGDGVSDDTEALQQALRVLPPGETLDLPPGSYRISAELHCDTPDLFLRGLDGPAHLIADAPTFHMLRLAHADRVRLEDLHFHGRARDDTTTQYAVYTLQGSAPSGVRLRHCRFTGVTPEHGLNSGVAVDTAADWTIDDCDFERLMGTHMGTGYGILMGGVRGSQITNNRFYGAPGQGRHAVYLSSSGAMGSCFNTIALNHAYDLNEGAICVYAPAGRGVNVGNTIALNHIVGGGNLTGNSGAIEVDGNADSTIVTQNQIHGFRAHGVAVEDFNTGGNWRTLVTQNQIHYVGLSGVQLEGARGAQVRGNTIWEAGQAGDAGTYPAIGGAGFGETALEDAAITGNWLGGNGRQRAAIVLDATKGFASIASVQVYGNHCLRGLVNTIELRAPENMVGTQLRDNVGYLLRASGTAIIPQGERLVRVAHGLPVVPRINDFTLVPISLPAKAVGVIGINGITETDFVLFCAREPGPGNLPVAWAVEVQRV